ncbi:hypothetical protein L2E82_06269 [Cichorium intybus]|uniref:Uncharacterized protein n=1 Tax=Cichorium intybus TaxID=13427 RepID=A0ACB9HA22_CICIN|nr:hypothetical protein L2E82_06269 [Cichorium intybus]
MVEKRGRWLIRADGKHTSKVGYCRNTQQRMESMHNLAENPPPSATSGISTADTYYLISEWCRQSVCVKSSNFLHDRSTFICSGRCKGSLDKISIGAIISQPRTFCMMHGIVKPEVINSNLHQAFNLRNRRQNPLRSKRVFKKKGYLLSTSQMYKDLIAKCNTLGKDETRSRKKLEKAKENVEKLKTTIQETDTSNEMKDNKLLRALKASQNTKSSPNVLNAPDPTHIDPCTPQSTINDPLEPVIDDHDILFRKTKRFKGCEKIDERNNKDGVCGPTPEIKSYILIDNGWVLLSGCGWVLLARRFHWKTRSRLSKKGIFLFSSPHPFAFDDNLTP